MATQPVQVPETMEVEAYDARYAADPPPEPALGEHYRQTRQFSDYLCAPLETEDYVVQSMANTSPIRWHLAHTTWFFETLILRKAMSGYKPFNPEFEYLFNSYYNTLGAQYPRPKRGLVTRPAVAEVQAYRAYVDEHIEHLLQQGIDEELAPILRIGIHHEQQHQELIMTDIKHAFSYNPLFPVYREGKKNTGAAPPALTFHSVDERIYWVGHRGDRFAYDNEGPRHRALVHGFQFANRLITNKEYLEFIEDGGYKTSTLWLSDGWGALQEHGWQHPLYWHKRDDGWHIYTLNGLQQLNPHEPVCHLNYYEADAFATWAGARLPTEFEWEVAARTLPLEGNFVNNEAWHPRAVEPDDAGPLHQVFGDVWEWTRSSYAPYPGYEPVAGPLGEYNGKFMCNQYVLRGGSCATSQNHMRVTYRNFFHADAQWQFSGLRLAKDAA